MRLVLLAMVGLLSCAAGLVAHVTDAANDLELETVDARFSIRGKEEPPRDVVVVAIDDKTFEDLNVRWPFPRSLHARLIDRLRKHGAHAIAYDVQFTEPSEPAEDLALLDSVKRAGNVVLATTEVGPRGSTNILGGDENVRAARARAGNANFPLDSGGVVRRFFYSSQGLKSLAVATVERVRGRPVDRGEFDGQTAWIDFAGPERTFRTVSFSDALQGRAPTTAFKGRIVVVGASAPTLQDVHATSTTSAMSGPEIQANAITTLERGVPLGAAPGWVNVAIIVLLGLLAPAVGLRMSALQSLAMSAAALALLLVGAQLAFNGGAIVELATPIATLALSAVGALAVHYLTEVRERHRTRVAFARFVPPEVVDDVLDQAGDDFRLGGKELEATVMFSDVRGFTTFSERTPAPQVIEFLNYYLTEMTDAIMAHGGTLIAYMGDGIMALFGAPMERADDADRAVAAAREMLEVRLPRVRQMLRERGDEWNVQIGIGLNSGRVMVGNIGSNQCMAFTAIGDTTNTASRLESMTKGSGYALYLSESTYAALSRREGLHEVGEVAVRGREAPLSVWGYAVEAHALDRAASMG